MRFLLWTKGSHQDLNFETFNCYGENSLNFSCHFPNHKSALLQILHHTSESWKITPVYFFSSNIIYFAEKEPNKVQAFGIFKCSSQNSPNFYHFWNNKSVFLQIGRHSSLLIDITSLYFFTWNFIYFQQKEPIKVQIWQVFTWTVESSKIPLWCALFVQIMYIFS